MTSKIRNIFRGFLELFCYIVSDKNKHFLRNPLPIFATLILLGIIGILRNLLEVYLGGKWARAWFALTPDVFMTMFFYPIFLCFFPATLVHFISSKLKLKIEMNEVYSLFFFIQIVHLVIPFFDGLAEVYGIPYHFHISSMTYKKLLCTPLPFTPLILLYTTPTSLGIDIVWIFVTIVFLKIYIKFHKFPVFESLITLSLSFYVLYMSVYPTYYFFLNEKRIGSNYMFGLFFMFMAMPSILYVASHREREHPKELLE